MRFHEAWEAKNMLRRVRLAVSGKRLALRVEQMEVVDVGRDRDARSDFGAAVPGGPGRPQGSIAAASMDVARPTKVLHGFDGAGEDHSVTRAFPQVLGSDPKRY